MVGSMERSPPRQYLKRLLSPLVRQQCAPDRGRRLALGSVLSQDDQFRLLGDPATDEQLAIAVLAAVVHPMTPHAVFQRCGDFCRILESPHARAGGGIQIVMPLVLELLQFRHTRAFLYNGLYGSVRSFIAAADIDDSAMSSMSNWAAPYGDKGIETILYLMGLRGLELPIAEVSGELRTILRRSAKTGSD
jgi:hypothetical protein